MTVDVPHQCPSIVRRFWPALAVLAMGACGRIGVALQGLPHDAGTNGAAHSSTDAGGRDTSPSRADAGTMDGGAGNDDASKPGAAVSGGDASVQDAAAGSRDAGAPDAAHSGAHDANTGAGGGPPTNDAGADAAMSAVCGNSVVELGEECDEGAGSEHCNADCTFASCGDGVWNALAGEACDSGGRLASCSVVCRVPECRAGCTCEIDRGVRYMYCAEQLAWQPATQACKQLGMWLLRIASGTEQTFLLQRSQQYNFPKFQLGATDLVANPTSPPCPAQPDASVRLPCGRSSPNIVRSGTS